MIQDVAEKAVVVLSWAMTLVLCLGGIVILGYLCSRGFRALERTLSSGRLEPVKGGPGPARVFDGIFPAIVGTLYLVVLSTVLAVPVGVCSGIYLAEYAGPGMKKLFGMFFDILAGIPSIVIGLFGFSLAIFLHNHFSDRFGPCLLISAMSLAVLVLPYIVRSTQISLEELAGRHPQNRPCLGATKLQNIAYVLIPNALSGISSGIIPCHRQMRRGHGGHPADRRGGHRRRTVFPVVAIRSTALLYLLHIQSVC